MGADGSRSLPNYKSLAVNLKLRMESVCTLTHIAKTKIVFNIVVRFGSKVMRISPHCDAKKYALLECGELSPLWSAATCRSLCGLRSSLNAALSYEQER